MKQLITRWGQVISERGQVLSGKGQVHQEYPRPGMVRSSYLNLNGEWDYCINESKAVTRYNGKILVPYSPECLLSGVQRLVTPEKYLHYRKRFRLPQGFQRARTLLHFGAVDQECDVSLNGVHLGRHVGGYTPFWFEVSRYLCEGENVLTLCVRDKTEELSHGRGKQKLHKKGKYSSLFYTPQSGIWKTVWMESVAEQYIEDVRLTPLYDEKAVKVHVTVAGETKKQMTSENSADVEEPKQVTIRVLADGETVGTAKVRLGCDAVIHLEQFHPWSPDHPYLYDVEICFDEDKVRSYFGMRKVSVGRDKNGILRFLLNNEPYFFNGLLDQGYWPESLMTPPSDEALKYDVVRLKEMGYNTIRKHVKVESDRFYYHCDKIGMLVWQDMPNGGGDYNMFFVTYLTNAFDFFARGVKDSHYKMFKRADEEGRAQYYKDLKEMVTSLYNHPSIAVWVPFNEGWGQFDANKATKLIRTRLDDTRLINEACGWFDQKGGDMYSIHNYIRRLRIVPQRDRVVALTEFGGYSCPVEGHTACEKEFGYKHCGSREELTNRYKKLWEKDIYPNISKGLSAAIYTQTSDIEEEVNGVMTYDREEDKMIVEEVQKINQKVYEIFRGCT